MRFGPDCTEECDGEGLNHYHCTLCGGICGLMGHLYEGCPEPKTPEVAERVRKRSLEYLIESYRENIGHDNNAIAGEIFIKIKLKATPEEFAEFLLL